jgi:hypothetical protein
LASTNASDFPNNQVAPHEAHKVTASTNWLSSLWADTLPFSPEDELAWLPVSVLEALWLVGTPNDCLLPTSWALLFAPDLEVAMTDRITAPIAKMATIRIIAIVFLFGPDFLFTIYIIC